MKLTAEERETVVLGNAASREWIVTTADTRIINRLKKRGWTPQELGSGCYFRFILPFSMVSFRSNRPTRINSESKRLQGLRLSGRQKEKAIPR